MRRAYHAPAAALTGRLDPTPDVAAAGAWKEVPRWGAKIQEARSDRRRACRSNVVRCDGLDWRIRRPTSILSVWNGRGVADPETRAGPKIAARGCRKATPGTVRSPRARKAL